MTDGPAFLLPGAADLPLVGYDRCEPPRETLARLAPHFARLGITRVGELTGLDELGLPIAFATRPNSFTLSVSLGRGLDRDSALISAAMEAAESRDSGAPSGVYSPSQLGRPRGRVASCVSICNELRGCHAARLTGPKPWTGCEASI